MSGNPSGWHVRYKLDVNDSTVYTTPHPGYFYYQVSPQGVNVDLGVGSHTAKFYIGEPSGFGGWDWTLVDTKNFEVVACEVPEPCEGSIDVVTDCEYATITVNSTGPAVSFHFILTKEGTGSIYETPGDVTSNPWSTVVWDGALEPGNYTAEFYTDCMEGSVTQTFSIEACEEPGPESGNITVVKRDPGGNLLAGAGFTVYLQASGNPALPEGFTDGSGMITFPGLPFDTYIVRETTAPAGFGLAPDQTAVLNVDNLAVTLNFVDDPITTGGGEATTTTTTAEVVTPPVVEVLGVTEELPFTGQSMWLYIIGAAMLALAGGLTFVLRAAKSKE